MRISDWSSDVCSSDLLHAMAESLGSAFGFTAFDVIMPCASLYHGTAWGLPFAAPICGAKFVLPADRMDGASLHELIVNEGVTFTGGVPTIWTGYLNWLDQNGATPGSLKRLTIGGSAVPRVMAERSEERRVGKECVSTCRSRWAPYH